MKYLKEDPSLGDADSGEDVAESAVLLESQLEEFRRQMLELPPNYDPLSRADLLLQIGRTLIRLERNQDAWDAGREAFDIFIGREAWEGATQACDIMFLSDQPESLAALGQGIWLAVTFPVDPELTVAMLQHVVDETPPDSDGAAVAATVAHYVVDLRARDRQRVLHQPAAGHGGAPSQRRARPGSLQPMVQEARARGTGEVPAAPAQRRGRASAGRMVVRPRGHPREASRAIGRES